jgi:Ca2+-binding EF-hand superfamily protein
MADNCSYLLSINNAFKFYDYNGDGVIGREELKRYFKDDKVVDAIIERLDKNKDGVISYSGITTSTALF